MLGINLSLASLTFTVLNWSVAQTVTVSAPDDNTPQGSRNIAVNHSSTSSDPQYNTLLIPPVIAHVLDDDSPGVNIIESGGSTEVTEGGPADSYQINLSTIPADNVTVSVYASNEIQLSETSLVFTPADWNSFQSVEASAPDDSLIQGDRVVNLSHTVGSSDPDYNGIAAAGIAVTIHDNDVPGFVINESNGNTAVTEGGGGDSYTLALKTCPSGDVTVSLSSSDQIAISPSILVFTPANWNQPQGVTVAAVDDNLAEGPHNTAITYTVQSNDLNYQSLTIPSLQVNITDNDTSSGGGENSDNDSANPYPSNPAPVSSTTGSADVAPQSGGNISLDNDAVLQIAAGALGGGSAVKLVITRVVPKPAAPPGYRIPGDAFRFTVDGAEHYKFAKPIRISLAFDPAALSPLETPGIYYFDEARGDWVSVTGEISGHTVSVIVDHFNIFAVMVKEPVLVPERHQGPLGRASYRQIAGSGNSQGLP